MLMCYESCRSYKLRSNAEKPLGKTTISEFLWLLSPLIFIMNLKLFTIYPKGAGI